MNFFRSYPEGESDALGICIYYVAKLYSVFGGGCIGLSSARRSTPLGVPTDMLSVVKKDRPIKPGDL